jgi:excisionase family DNA binding protein
VSPARTDPGGSANRPSKAPGSDIGASALPHLLDITALAEHLGVTPRHIRRLVAERRVPFVRWGHLIRFDPDEIVTWLEQARIPGNDSA